MLLSELSIKDVISEKNGAKIGRISDMEVDIATGRILRVKVHNGLKIFNFFSGKDALNIPWQKIVKVGNDVIIVDTDYQEIKKEKEKDKKEAA